MQSEKIRHFGYAIDCLVKSIKSCYSYYLLLCYDCRLVPGFWGLGIELLSSSNITLRFEDVEYKETCLPDLSGQKWEVHKMPSILISEEGVYLKLTNRYSQPRYS